MPDSNPKPKKKLKKPSAKNVARTSGGESRSKPSSKKKEGRLVAPAKKKLKLSPEERKRRSDAAKQRIAEGKMGGSEHGKKGGRPRKKRASEVVAEEAQKNGNLIASVFIDAMDDENPHSVRIKAAEAMVKIEEKEERLQLDEEERLRQMNREDLVAAVAAKFAGNPMVFNVFKQAGERKDLPAGPEVDENGNEIVDAEVVA